jgi:dihydrofolate reductase
MSFLDEALNQAIGETIAGEFDMLLGRRTYKIFAAYWPNQGDNPIAKAFNKATKYVATRSLDQLDWENSQHIGGDVVDEVRWLKASDGPALHIWGSSELLQTLIAAGRPATWSLSGCNAEHAKGRPPQHLPACRPLPKV